MASFDFIYFRFRTNEPNDIQVSNEMKWGAQTRCVLALSLSHIPFSISSFLFAFSTIQRRDINCILTFDAD